MKSLIHNKYKKNNITKSWLNKNGFYKIISYDEETYRYMFGIYKYHNSPLLDCELILFFESGEVKMNVYNHGTRSRYTPFYHSEYGNYERVVRKINKEINSKIKELGIEKVK